MKFLKVNLCPLCLSKKKKFHSFCDANLYSEFLSREIKLNEKILLKKIYNVQCINCNLIYKNFWFANTLISKLFNKLIPYHPKGRDIFSQKFSKKFFLKELDNLEKALIKNNIAYINKSKRILIGIIKSTKVQINYKKKLEKNLEETVNIKNLKKKMFKSFSKKITEPQPFSRFSGYGNRFFFNEIKKMLKNKTLKSYAEIGCPSWGILNYLKSKKINKFFFTFANKNFWGKKCYYGKNGCLNKCGLSKYNIKNLESYSKQVTLFGIIEYLDHLKNPMNFLNLLKKKTKFFFVVLDNAKKLNIPIQHYTGWDSKSLKFLAKNINRKVIIRSNIIVGKKMILGLFV